MYVRPLIASAERSIMARQRWSTCRAPWSQARQKRVGGSQTRVGLVDAARSGKTLRPGERAVDLLPLFERMPCPDAFALDPHPHVGPEPDRLTGTGRVGGVTVPVDERPLPGRAPVVEDHLAHQLDVDTAFQAQHGAHQHVIAVAVGRRPGVRGDRVLVLSRAHRQRVANDAHSRRRVPRRDEGVRRRLIDAGGRDVDPEGRQPEGACLTVEERAEHAGRVEPGTHSQSIEPSGATSAPVWQFERNP